MHDVTVLLEYNKRCPGDYYIGEGATHSAELSFERRMSRIPRVGEGMDFEGVPGSSLVMLNMQVTSVTESFYLDDDPDEPDLLPATRTDLTARVTKMSSDSIREEDLRDLVSLYAPKKEI